MSTRIKLVGVTVVLLLVLAAGFGLNHLQAGAPPTPMYEVDGDQINTERTFSSSSTYEMIDAVQLLGAEGGVQSSSNYSIAVTILDDPTAASASVTSWQTLED